MFVEFDPGLLRHETAQRIVALQYDRASHLVGRYGPDGRDRCVEDIAFSLLYLDAAVAMGRAELFLEYLRWLKQLFARLGIAIEDLAGSLEAMRDVLTAEGHAAAAAVVDAGVRALPGLEVVPWRPMEDCGHLADVAWAYLNALLGGDRRRAGQVVGDAAAGGVAIEDLYLHVFQPCLREVGRRWLEGEVSVAVEHLFTAATQMILSQFYPRIFERPANGKTVLAVCAEGELHEVGIRMVADLFQLDGWTTTYLGASTPQPAVLTMLRRLKPDLLLVSSTISVNLPRMRALIQAVRSDPSLPGLKIMVGGHPFAHTGDLWRSVGADGWAADGREAVALARTWAGLA